MMDLNCNPAVSVIVPVFNGEKYLVRCVESVLLQSFADFELILVDDGSTDRCGEICDEYAEKDSRIKVIHKKNGGVSRARNSGLEAAKGRYICFCDCDDYYETTLLDVCYWTAQQKNADVVSFELQRLANTENKRRTPMSGEYILTKETRFEFLRDIVTWKTGGWQACRSFFRRSLVSECGIHFCDTCNNFAEDLGFTLEFMLYASRVVFIPEYLYIYDDTREDSMMHKSKNIYRVNDVNELSVYLSKKFSAHAPEIPYSVLHHYIIQNQVRDLYSVKAYQEIREWDSRLHRLDNLDFFRTENLEYLRFSHRNISLCSMNVAVDRYLSDLNFMRFSLSFFLCRVYSAIQYWYKKGKHFIRKGLRKKKYFS